MPDSRILSQRGYVRLKTILKILPVGRSTWWTGVKTGRFPKGVKLGKNTTAWRVEDIEALLESFGQNTKTSSHRLDGPRG